MSAEVPQLKASRRGLRGLLTKRIKELNEVVDVERLQEKLDAVVETCGKLRNIQDQICQLLEEDDEIEEQRAYFERIDSEVCDVRVKTEEKIRRMMEGKVPFPFPADDVRPEDSASQASRSSVAGSRASGRSGAPSSRASAKAASLSVIVESLQERQRLEMEELRVRHQKEELELKTQLAVAQAEMAAVGGSRISSIRSSRVHQRTVTNVDCGRNGTLNANAELFYPQPAAAKTVESLQGVAEAVRVGQQQMLNVAQLPKPELICFDGDPLKYWVFIKAFDSRVFAADNAAKLMLLIQYCTGKAKTLIEPCVCLENGYSRARELLKQRFGDDYTISQAWVRKVAEGQQIGPRDFVMLQELADDLNSCVDTLSTMGYVAEISTQRVMVQIISRLPMYLRTRWLREVQNMRSRGGKPPDVLGLAKFLESAAEEANDPVYSGLLYDKSSRHQGSAFMTVGHSEQFQSGSSSVTAGRSRESRFGSSPVGHSGRSGSPAVTVDKSCELCMNGNHSLFSCVKFRDMAPQGRKKYAFNKRLCFNCLRTGHVSSSCKLDRVCTVDGCSQKHTKFLHVSEPQRTPRSESDSVDATGEVGCNAVSGGKYRLALPIVPVKVRAPGSSQTLCTYALLDNGSTSTFCTDGLVERLGVRGDRETLILNTIDRPNKIDTRVVTIEVSSVIHDDFDVLNSVYTRSAIPCDKTHIAVQADVERFPHLKGLRLPEVRSDQVTILIGQDNAELMMPLEVRHGIGPGMPYAVKTKLGWALNGPLSPGRGLCLSTNFVDCRLEDQLERFWKVEGWEQLNGPEKSLSLEDERTLGLWKNEITQDDDGHYVFPVPFRSQPSFPDSRPLAERRLQLLRKRLVKDQVLREEYVKIMAALLWKGHAEEVSEHDTVGSPLWYLPHHPVISPKKVRVVFDCAAQVDDVSLNSLVMQGPDVTNDLASVLLRFRLGPIAVQGDIEAMFYQVRVSPKDRDVLRFLWWRDGDLNGEVAVYRMTAHLFGGTWSPACCGFVLRHVADQGSDKYGSLAAETVKRNFYVDDCLVAVDTVEGAVRLVQDLKGMLSEGGFRITKFASNCREVVNLIPVEDRANGVLHLDLDSDGVTYEKALGLIWELGSDTLTFSVRMENKPRTRRGMLSGVSAVFDPLGFVAPFVVKGRLIIQELTRLGIGWDDQPPDSILSDWENWSAELPVLQGFQIDRCVKPTSAMKFELHHFADASTKAYGSVAYLRVLSEAGGIDCHLLMSRSRLAPLKQLSIPRLELSAASLAVKMDSMLQRELNIEVESSYFWTDSMVVLGYIKNPQKRYHTFVANRVSAIQAGSRPDQWRHVASADNPADIISRGMTAQSLIESKMWKIGPWFLTKPVEDWPVSDVKATVGPGDPEVKQSPQVNFSVVGDIIQDFILYHSSWFQLKKRVALLLRVEAWLRLKVSGGDVPDISLPVNSSEMENAELAIVGFVQKKEFPLYFGKVLPQRGTLASLGACISVGGLLVVGGRIARGEFEETVKHPLILPKWHHIVDLIVSEVHQSHGHAGQEHVLAMVRQRFWIVSGRQAVKRVLRRCVKCRRWSAKVVTQRMADLPKCRLETTDPPFSSVGIDFFGPLMVKRGRSVLKRYGCLFTCMTVRAVHLEICHSLDTDSFIHCLHRFMARRGCPRDIYCDNGTNFVGAEGQLKDLLGCLDQNRIHGVLLAKKVDWHFNPPHASHMGGAWERLIRSVKKVLRPMLSEQVMDDEALVTLMCIVESVINSRPLTHLSDDASDLGPLTPNHLLRPGTCSVVYPEKEFGHKDLYVTRRWRQVQYHADLFWRRWTREYVPMLQARAKWCKLQRDIAVDDVVLVVEETPRGEWPLARVTEVYPGADGHVRKVKVKTKSTELLRPITKLCLLEEAN